MVNGEVAQCTPTNKLNPEFDKPIKDMLGFICVSPDDFGILKKHHINLHKDIDGSRPN